MFDALLVEDDDLIRDSVAMGVEEAGLSVYATGSCREAVILLRAASARVLLLDISLCQAEHGGSYRVAAEARALGVPIVLVSGVNDLDRHVHRFGAVAALQKPFTLDELLTVLRLWRDRRPRRPNGAGAFV